MAIPDPAITAWVPIWNNKTEGPVGPPGPVGPQGPVGPPGPATGFFPGMVVPYAGSAAPTGWLIANGQAVSRATYAALYAVVGGIYGTGDGVSTFNLPDLRGRVPMGGGAGGGLTNRTLASALGAEGVALTTPQLPSHFHDITDKLHRHQSLQANIGGGVEQGAPSYRIQPGALYLLDNDLGKTLIDYAFSNITATNGAGGDQPHDNVQPSLVLTYIIKF
jgi:microcystin-dependent protein